MSQYIVTTPEGRQLGPTDFQTLAQWAAEGRVGPGMTVEDLLSGQMMKASNVPGLYEEAEKHAVERPISFPRSLGMISLVLGAMSMVAWCVPVFGFPLSTLAILMGARSLRSEHRIYALIGMTLGVASLLMGVAALIVLSYYAQKLGLTK